MRKPSFQLHRGVGGQRVRRPRFAAQMNHANETALKVANPPATHRVAVEWVPVAARMSPDIKPQNAVTEYRRSWRFPEVVMATSSRIDRRSESSFELRL